MAKAKSISAPVRPSKKTTSRTTPDITKATPPQADSFTETPFTLHSIHNVAVTLCLLEDCSEGGLLRSLVRAFCEHSSLPYGRYPDVYPMVHQSKRAGADLLFKLGTNDLKVRTVGGWTFQEGDWVEVDDAWKNGYSHGDLVVGLVSGLLGIVELRALDDNRDDRDALRPYDLRNGDPVGEAELLIFGPVREVRRGYWPCEFDEEKTEGAA